MSDFREQDRKARESAAAKAEREEAEMREIGKLFATPEGARVLELFCRRFGVLGRRFRLNERGELNAIRAGIKDGEAAVVLFIIECLQKAGKTSITLPL